MTRLSRSAMPASRTRVDHRFMKERLAPRHGRCGDSGAVGRREVEDEASYPYVGAGPKHKVAREMWSRLTAHGAHPGAFAESSGAAVPRPSVDQFFDLDDHGGQR